MFHRETDFCPAQSSYVVNCQSIHWYIGGFGGMRFDFTMIESCLTADINELEAFNSLALNTFLCRKITNFIFETAGDLFFTIIGYRLVMGPYVHMVYM